MTFTVAIFLLVYVAMGAGQVPGFKVDRTGAAVVGALVLIAAGRLSPQDAWDAIDYKTVALLFGLMVVSAAFIVSGFYGWATHRFATLDLSPPALLAVLIVISGLLSSVLTNDVVVVAMTPLLVAITLSRGLNPVPFLLGFCFAANTGSAGTIIGSPQNIIAAQGLGMSFNEFLRVAAVPALASLPIVWGIVAFLYRGRWHGTASGEAVALPPTDHRETVKAAAVTLIVILAFVATDWPKELVAMAATAVLLVNRRIASSDMLGHVDGNLLLLLMCLFIVNAALAATGLPQQLLGDLKAAGIDLEQPLTLFLVVSALSDTVGNNPAVMLLIPYVGGERSDGALGAAFALGTGFSSNMFVFGSLAGIIVVEQAKKKGVAISFGEFTRSGLPISLACMAMAMGWIAFLGR
ncbi:SLC13 family permease [Ferirhizobium litorale]|uniref:Transporter n=1 Tax=Ferirhizobium litorale TaxID=2927786 RepID=A0AAE3QDZ7_9HYPH|nr:SLC13 family permease [Fererhizobium litorale]MDI7922103.1 transporter [Fererhizobium litorale]